MTPQPLPPPPSPPKSLVTALLPTSIQARLPATLSLRHTLARVVGAATGVETTVAHTNSQQQHQHQQLSRDVLSSGQTAVAISTNVRTRSTVDMMARSGNKMRGSGGGGGGVHKSRGSGGRKVRFLQGNDDNNNDDDDSDDDDGEKALESDVKTPLTKQNLAKMDEGKGSSGVDWQRAANGLTFLHLARDQAHSHPTSTSTSSSSAPETERFLYMHAISGFLASLPTDLTSSEFDQLHASLPPTLALTNTTTTTTTATSSSSYNSQCTSCYPSSQHPQTRLHRTVRLLTSHLIVLITFLLPWIIHVLRAMDQEYQLWARGAEIGRRLVDGLGRSRVREAVGDVALWGVEGVVGGMTEGLVDGLGGRRARRR